MIQNSKTVLFVTLVVIWSLITLANCNPKSKTEANAQDDSDAAELQQRFKSLDQQLNELSSAQDPSTRQQLMQQNWQSMQQYMSWMHERWDAGMPWMMGRGMMHGNEWTACPFISGPGHGWQLPADMSSSQYLQQMRDHMQRMQEQVNAIAQTKDPEQQRRLMQEHWQTMYQDMQGMRGMGWMWNGPMGMGMMRNGRMGPGMMRDRGTASTENPSKPLPDPDSAGAKLVSTYCTQCHAAPSPALHTRSEWAAVLKNMVAYTNNNLPGIKSPSREEMDTLLNYMQQHAP